MAADDVTIDLEDRDLVFDRPEHDSLTIDLEDRDLVLDPSDGDVTAEFGAAGVPGPTTYQLWLNAGNVGSLDDFIARGGAITDEILATKIAPILQNEMTLAGNDAAASARLDRLEAADPGDLTLLFENGLI